MLSNRLLWPGMIGVALAVGLGVQMGENVIGSINPIHFQGAAPPVQAIDPNASPPPAEQTSFAQAYGWDQGYAAQRADSVGAGAAQDFDYVPQPSLQRAAAPAWQADTRPINLTPWPPGQVSAHPEIERYTDYPIEEKPAAQPSPAPAPAAEPEQPAPTDKTQLTPAQ
jgi:hypothetical protein